MVRVRSEFFVVLSLKLSLLMVVKEIRFEFVLYFVEVVKLIELDVKIVFIFVLCF